MTRPYRETTFEVDRLLGVRPWTTHNRLMLINVPAPEGVRLWSSSTGLLYDSEGAREAFHKEVKNYDAHRADYEHGCYAPLAPDKVA